MIFIIVFAILSLAAIACSIYSNYQIITNKEGYYLEDAYLNNNYIYAVAFRFFSIIIFPILIFILSFHLLLKINPFHYSEFGWLIGGFVYYFMSLIPYIAVQLSAQNSLQ